MKIIIWGFEPDETKEIREELVRLNCFPIHLKVLGDLFFHWPNALICPLLGKEGLMHDLTYGGAVEYSLSIIEIGMEGDWKKMIAEELPKVSKARAFPVCSETRTVLHDTRYSNFTTHQKLKRSDEHLEVEMEKAFSQFQMAKKHLPQAQEYFSDLLCYDRRTVRPEIAYRLVHGSYKVFWARDQIIRYLSLLSFFIPKSDPNRFPLPAPGSQNLEILKYELDEGDLHVLDSFIDFTSNPIIRSMIVPLCKRAFKGEDEIAIFRLGIEYMGLLELLHQVAKAQIRIMAQFSCIDSQWHQSSGLASRRIHRSFQLWADFWGFNGIRVLELDFPFFTKKWVEAGI